MAEKHLPRTGMKFPPQVNPATGKFALSTGAQSVKESIYLILMTRKTERMVRPSFGSSIAEYTFMDMTETKMTMLAEDLRADILLQEPEISDLDISMTPVQDKGCLMVEISYAVAENGEKGSLAFPFYLYGDSEGAEDRNVYESQ